VSDTPTTIDPAHFRTVLGHYASGLTVITAVNDGTPVGMTCQSFSSVSLDPPLVLFCATKTSTSWAGIRAAGHFCANVLRDDQEEVSRVFASKIEDKFAGIGWTAGPSGAPVLQGVLATIDCEINAIHEAGDHDIVVGRVLELHGGNGAPLVFFRGGYGRLGI
jgi:3-hydroxy-9,10-secoandrosta-1,3,5(10)-triene-9,17-dione monooxygenase reductase component